ncbi:hypothetical protein X793_07290 [Dehalococcoides mccartyi CG4]|nr:hypothetical protein X793_07290 [Dehalococcoides mccartyi CG4]
MGGYRADRQKNAVYTARRQDNGNSPMPRLLIRSKIPAGKIRVSI